MEQGMKSSRCYRAGRIARTIVKSATGSRMVIVHGQFTKETVELNDFVLMQAKSYTTLL